VCLRVAGGGSGYFTCWRIVALIACRFKERSWRSDAFGSMYPIATAIAAALGAGDSVAVAAEPGE
jgi:hypothetical protein